MLGFAIDRKYLADGTGCIYEIGLKSPEIQVGRLETNVMTVGSCGGARYSRLVGHGLHDDDIIANLMDFDSDKINAITEEHLKPALRDARSSALDMAIEDSRKSDCKAIVIFTWSDWMKELLAERNFELTYKQDPELEKHRSESMDKYGQEYYKMLPKKQESSLEMVSEMI